MFDITSRVFIDFIVPSMSWLMSIAVSAIFWRQWSPCSILIFDLSLALAHLYTCIIPIVEFWRNCHEMSKWRHFVKWQKHWQLPFAQPYRYWRKVSGRRVRPAQLLRTPVLYKYSSPHEIRRATYLFLSLVLVAWSEEIWKLSTQTGSEFQTATYKLVLLTATSLVVVGVNTVWLKCLLVRTSSSLTTWCTWFYETRTGTCTSQVVHVPDRWFDL